MFDGKILRVAMGTPMRRIARANNSLAEAEPEPFTLPNFTTKSLTALICLDMEARLCRVDEEFLHIPGAGRAALGPQPAVQTQIFVLHHHASGFERFGDVEVLIIRVGGGGRQTG